MRLLARSAVHLNWPPWSRRLSASLYFIALNWLLLAPAATFVEVEEFLPHQDKIAHAVLFLALAFLVRWSLPAPGGPARRRLGVFAALLLYAAGIEALQPVLGGEGRLFDWLDMAGNLAGVGCGWLLCGLAGEYHSPGSRSPESGEAGA